jgi:chorismate synthase
MSSNSFGTICRVTTFGESHGPALGAVVDGVPAGLGLTEEIIQADMDRRRPGRGDLTSPRDEADRVHILSGVFEDRTTGAPVGLLIHNKDARPSDYERWRDTFRPGHADVTWQQKFGHRDWRGGGRASGRETAARVAAGAVARALLREAGVEVLGVVQKVGGITTEAGSSDWEDWEQARDHPLRCVAANVARFEEEIRTAKEAGDSVGGVVEIRARGVPAGLGEPVFDKLDARLGGALLSIGAVKGVEIGAGFALAGMRGSESNDPIEALGRFSSNRSGGILGGISNGEQIVVRAAVKPTASISTTQQTVDRDGEPRDIRIEGRHDPCIAPRLVAVAEAMVCLVLADAQLAHRARQGFVSEGTPT